MRHFITLALLPLAACTVATSDATADSVPPPLATCRNDALSQFIGQPASQELGQRMLRASGARIIRWVPKGGVITMDFSPERLTVQLDGSNRVERASCG
ncbi:MAG TPA: I78 family peptidase inhibitor [Sphingomicrobium sp.]|nr:I78 family peptidase inhibitor [Sphingomicrobium sp.]